MKLTKREQAFLEAILDQPMVGRALANKLGWAYWNVYDTGRGLADMGLVKQSDYFDTEFRIRTFTITTDGRYAISRSRSMGS